MVESRFPGSIVVPDVALVDKALVKGWAQKFTQVSLVLVGGGPPCQGVSGLNAARKGALRDERSALFCHVDRIRGLVKECFPWAQVQGMMENVASMDSCDEQLMSDSFGDTPWFCDAADVSLARRPRLYWLDWGLVPSDDAKLGHTPAGRKSVHLTSVVDESNYLTPGWSKTQSECFPTFTTSRPRSKPGYKPAGIQQCNPTELSRWEKDEFRFPPYQYQDKFCVKNKKGALRLPNVQEREVIMGFPKDSTQNCMPKGEQKSQAYLDTRLTLIGNSWNVTVVAWFLSQLGERLGLNETLSVGDVVQRTAPGCDRNLLTFLYRPPMVGKVGTPGTGKALDLVYKLMTLVGMKGEDISLQASSEDLVRYHRLRASIPAKLWKWKTVASWHWTGDKEHINCLELRAVLTALRWRLERHKKVHVRFVHMLDSLVCLHCLSRGRSSSRKLRRTMLRINALLLATRSQAVWSYVHTAQNPADAPSRRPQKRKWARCQKGI